MPWDDNPVESTTAFFFSGGVVFNSEVFALFSVSWEINFTTLVNIFTELAFIACSAIPFETTRLAFSIWKRDSILIISAGSLHSVFTSHIMYSNRAVFWFAFVVFTHIGRVWPFCVDGITNSILVNADLWSRSANDIMVVAALWFTFVSSDVVHASAFTFPLPAFTITQAWAFWVGSI